MSTITREFTKEQLQQIIETDHVQCGEASALARIALASLEAEAIAVRARWKDEGSGHGDWRYYNIAHRDALMADETRECEIVYTAPPAPVVPDEMPAHIGPREFGRPQAYIDGWNACRAAMLQGAEHSRIDMLCKVLKNAPLSPSDSQGRKKVDVENDNQQFESLSKGKK